MAELPEVETIRTELRPYVIGRRITGITLLWERVVHQPSLPEFRLRLIGQSITGINRRGKYLIFTLSSGDFWVVHLKMTGSLLAVQDSAEPPRYTTAIIHLDKGQIFLRDPRKFGAMWIVKDGNSIVGELGPEPLEPGFTPEVLAKLLSRRKAPIKALLCDQNFIAGVGNMYADEALFAAGIHPLRPGASLSQQEVERLHRAVRQVLLSALRDKGASVENYFRPDGTLGTAHFSFKVAHRRGKLCPACQTPLERIEVRHRGTYFCPRCQRLETV